MHGFKPGDIVQLSPKAAQKSKFPNRRGTVVSVTRTPSQINVLWHETKTPQSMQLGHRPAWRETPQGEDW